MCYCKYGTSVAVFLERGFKIAKEMNTKWCVQFSESSVEIIAIFHMLKMFFQTFYAWKAGHLVQLENSTAN